MKRFERQPPRGYAQARRAEHRIVAIAHHQQPPYSRRFLRMLTRLFR